MDFAKLNAPTLKELFVKELESMILSGKLEIGERLPSERELAEKMQVSRAVVNSGIAELARKGFLMVKPRSGVYVLDYRRYGTVETLLSIMNYNGGQLRRDDIRSILEMKMVVDKLAVELASENGNDENFKHLEKRLEEMKLIEEKDVKKAAAAAFEFYHEITMISGNTLLPLIYRSFRVPVLELWERFIRKYGNEVVCSSIDQIFAALVKHDKAQAIEGVEMAIAAAIKGKREIYDE